MKATHHFPIMQGDARLWAGRLWPRVPIGEAVLQPWNIRLQENGNGVEEAEAGAVTNW